MINRKIAASALSIVTALSLMGGATYAFFSDQNTSTGNTFAAGTLELQLDDVNEVATSSPISASIGGTGLVPGGLTTGFISLHNSGTIAMSQMTIGANQTATVDNSDASNLATVLDLTVKTGTDNTCTSGAVDHTAAMALALGNNVVPLTLSELVATDYTALPALSAGGTYFVCITATLESGAGNQYQGDSVTEDFVFTGNQ